MIPRSDTASWLFLWFERHFKHDDCPIFTPYNYGNLPVHVKALGLPTESIWVSEASSHIRSEILTGLPWTKVVRTVAADAVNWAEAVHFSSAFYKNSLDVDNHLLPFKVKVFQCLR